MAPLLSSSWLGLAPALGVGLWLAVPPCSLPLVPGGPLPMDLSSAAGTQASTMLDMPAWKTPPAKQHLNTTSIGSKEVMPVCESELWSVGLPESRPGTTEVWDKDERDFVPLILDEGHAGAWTGNATAAAWSLDDGRDVASTLEGTEEVAFVTVLSRGAVFITLLTVLGD